MQTVKRGGWLSRATSRWHCTQEKCLHIYVRRSLALVIFAGQSQQKSTANRTWQKKKQSYVHGIEALHSAILFPNDFVLMTLLLYIEAYWMSGWTSFTSFTQIIGSQVLVRPRGHRTPTRWSRRPCIQARTWPAPIRTLTAAVSWAEPRSGSRFSNGVTRTLSRNGIVSFSLPVLWSQFEALDVARIRTRCAACQWW